MILRNGNGLNPQTPQRLMLIGMLCLALAAWPRFVHPATNLGPCRTDGLRGLLFGLSIGMNLVSVNLFALQRRNART
jgi:hypothetical protein